jgi:hypothetical protein
MPDSSRGLLLSGDGERYLSSDIVGGSGDTSEVEDEPAWWPQVNIPGRYLGPYLAGIAESARGDNRPTCRTPGASARLVVRPAIHRSK